ncbi:hypothetical protein AVEN_133082-1 [Araneus ventricosus]|uniref:Uncharacterized protein n=1 Tax=Araneus ventricosus TaxID=182803 RepID=A0A4Y2VPP0_ARAVE|nr:hypothetical protein AVEN_133082-1 [Araneus ventricosus]
MGDWWKPHAGVDEGNFSMFLAQADKALKHFWDKCYNPVPVGKRAMHPKMTREPRNTTNEPKPYKPLHHPHRTDHWTNCQTMPNSRSRHL